MSRESVILAAALLGRSPCRNPHGNVIGRRLGDADHDRDRLVAGDGLCHPARRGACEVDAHIIIAEGHGVRCLRAERPALRQTARKRQNDVLAPLGSFVVDAPQRHGRA